MNFPTELIRSINAGRCFALVGSGPSNELGYPSWAKLAETIALAFISDGTATDPESYKSCLANGQYPELFTQAEFDGGGRKKLVDTLRALLAPRSLRSGAIYEMLARWPFACYLTTNYDHEIRNHLERLGIHYTTLYNSVSDLQQLRDGVSHLIVKLHSDLDHPNEAVITSSDYKRFTTGTEGANFRAKLRMVFEMFDVVIVGHSVTDPDLRIVLQTAQETADPKRPIYMLAAGFNSIQVREFSQNFNIFIIPYDNRDGQHTELRRILRAADKFVTSRTTRLDLPPPVDQQEAEAATSMLIFRRLQAVKTQPDWSTAEYIGPLVLQALALVEPIADVGHLLSTKPFTSMLAVSDREILMQSVESARLDLARHGLLEGDLPLRRTEAGKAVSVELHGTRELERAQAYGQFTMTLRRIFPAISDSDSARAQELVEQCIVAAFRKRGLAIANSVFGDQTMGPEDLTTLFAAISQTSAHLESTDLQLAFTEAAHELLIAPTAPQKSYLTSLAQGFFLFHMLGYDASCAKVRQNLFSKTVWFCDSSVLIPLIAVGSQNNDCACPLS